MAKILCIEDEKELRLDIAEELRDAGYEVEEVADGQAGLTAILAQRPDLVLCDITMPGLSGYELLAEVRARHKQMADMPVIFLSALSGREQVLMGLEHGADDYLTKPVDFQLLLAKVRACIRRSERARELKEQEQIKLYKALAKEEKKTTDTYTTPNHWPLDAVFEKKLRDLHARGDKAVAGGVHIVTLKSVKEGFGSKWETHHEKIMLIAESVIRQRLAEKEICSRYGDEAFLLLMPELSEKDGESKARTIANEVRARLLGEDKEYGQILIDAVVTDLATVAPEQGTDVVTEVAQALAKKADLLSADSALAQTDTGSPRLVDRFLSQIEIKYRPIWSPKKGMVVSYNSYPYRSTPYGTIHGAAVLHGGFADPFAIELDIFLADQAIEAAIRLSHHESRPLVGLQAHFTSLIGTKKERLVKIFNKTHGRLPSGSLIVEIVGIPEFTPAAKIQEVVQLTLQYSKTVAVQLPAGNRQAALFHQAGATFQGFDLGNQQESQSEAAMLKKLRFMVAESTAAGLKPYILNVDTRVAFQESLTAGFVLLGGRIIGPDTAKPGSAYKVNARTILGL